MQTFLLYFLLFVVSFVQNMAFTWTSRSRNSGDPTYHRYAAWASNGVWFLCQISVVKLMWEPLMTGDFIKVVIGGLIYCVATAEGSVFMMKVLLGKSRFQWANSLFSEKGKKKVGER
jgi:hypothetical protein